MASRRSGRSAVAASSEPVVEPSCGAGEAVSCGRAGLDAVGLNVGSVGLSAEVLPEPGERGRDQAADHEVRRFHQIPPPWRHIPPPQIILTIPEPRTDLPGRSLQMAEPAMTEVIGTAAAELPTASFMKRAAEIVILDPVFGGVSGSSSEAPQATLPALTNGVLRLAVTTVEAVKTANDSRLKAAGKPVVNKDKSLARLVARVCRTDAPTDDAAAEREGKRLHKHLKTAESRAATDASSAAIALIKELREAGKSKEEAKALVDEVKKAKFAAVNKELVPALKEESSPPPPPRLEAYSQAMASHAVASRSVTARPAGETQTTVVVAAMPMR